MRGERWAEKPSRVSSFYVRLAAEGAVAAKLLSRGEEDGMPLSLRGWTIWAPC